MAKKRSKKAPVRLGRPKISEEHKRGVAVQVRLTQADYERLYALAERDGLSMAAWLRKQIQEG
jgi:hypothetical protein